MAPGDGGQGALKRRRLDGEKENVTRRVFGARGFLENINRENGSEARAGNCTSFLLKSFRSEFKTVEQRALVGIGKLISRYETENSNLRNLVIVSQERLATLSEKEEEVVRLKKMLADAMVNFGQASREKDLEIQQLTEQVASLKAALEDLQTKTETHVQVKKEPSAPENELAESLAEKEMTIVQLTHEIKKMTEAFQEKERGMEVQYGTFVENYSKRSIKVLDALTSQRDKVRTLAAEKVALENEVSLLKKQKKSIQELYRQKEIKLQKISKKSSAVKVPMDISKEEAGDNNLNQTEENSATTKSNKSETKFRDTGWAPAHELKLSDISSRKQLQSKLFVDSFKCGVCGYESRTKELLALHWRLEVGCLSQWSGQVGKLR